MVISSGSLWRTRSRPIAAVCGISKSGEKLDKDVFRRDLGNLAEAYTEVAKRLGVLPKTGGSRPKLVH